ncbi:type 2 periplasmic-binding domain-containing protein [Aureimonas psammosilenae]|uniref:extracellular solute-binding protein n=1 Tax=Aureimonas psammosilenae TaxID=2495496 RepID=UPI0012611E10|nr:extracellular solute-binding protein [Aureimonas psammosilenae]
MTWSHPRGIDPMLACSPLFEAKTGVKVEWDKRSLQDFESFPVEELAKAYDLLVIDHPHVGQITGEKCLLPLDVAGREAEREAMEAGSVGPSYRSYFWHGRQWGFPVDAATQILAYRPDRLARAPETIEEIRALSREKRLALPLRSPHALMTFFTLAAHFGTPCAVEPGPLIDRTAGKAVWSLLGELAENLDPGDFERDPIAVYERLAEPDSPADCTPYLYGYISYAREGFRARRLAFADIVRAKGREPVGATLGGTGIAVSAFSRHPVAALDFAYFIASAETQRGPYAAGGGQPGHAAAWEDEAVNVPVHSFYRDTRATLEGSYLRPRHNGYMAFQEAASHRISAGLRAKEPASSVLADLDRLFAASFQG